MLPLQEWIETFRELLRRIGKEGVIWCFNPLIVTKSLTSRQLLNRIRHIGSELKDYTEKLVVSFIGVKAYRKVQNNLVKETDGFTKENIGQAESIVFQIHEIAGGQA